LAIGRLWKSTGLVARLFVDCGSSKRIANLGIQVGVEIGSVFILTDGWKIAPPFKDFGSGKLLCVDVVHEYPLRPE